MIALKQILVATDFSEPASVAVNYGRDLGRAYDATLHVIHVIEEMRGLYGADVGLALADVARNIEAAVQLMITDHSGVNKAAVELVTRLKVTPQQSSTSKALQAGGDKNLAHLKTLNGAAFDQAYINHEYAYHQQVIDALDKTLIPGASNVELKALLIKVRPAFVAHRDHAKTLQSTSEAR